MPFALLMNVVDFFQWLSSTPTLCCSSLYDLVAVHSSNKSPYTSLRAADHSSSRIFSDLQVTLPTASLPSLHWTITFALAVPLHLTFLSLPFTPWFCYIALKYSCYTSKNFHYTVPLVTIEQILVLPLFLVQTSDGVEK